MKIPITSLCDCLTLTGHVDDFSTLLIFGDLTYSVENKLRRFHESGELASIDLDIETAYCVLDSAQCLNLRIHVISEFTA